MRPFRLKFLFNTQLWKSIVLCTLSRVLYPKSGGSTRLSLHFCSSHLLTLIGTTSINYRWYRCISLQGSFYAIREWFHFPLPGVYTLFVCLSLFRGLPIPFASYRGLYHVQLNCSESPSMWLSPGFSQIQPDWCYFRIIVVGLCFLGMGVVSASIWRPLPPTVSRPSVSPVFGLSCLMGTSHLRALGPLYLHLWFAFLSVIISNHSAWYQFP